MATRQRCPKCNELNPLDATHCANCAAPLTQTCPACGAERPWYVEVCPQCEGQAADASMFAEIFRREPQGRLQSRYTLMEAIGRGRATAVYRAQDADGAGHHSTVAIKELSTVALFRPEERREAESALRRKVAQWQAVDHPGPARILDVFANENAVYVVCEYVHGWTVGSLLRGERRATPELARNWGAQLCDMLMVMHKADPALHVPFLSPDHVMIQRDGQVRLVGLGLGALYRPNASRPYGSVRGYAAPELRQSMPSTASDIFAVGRLLYAVLIDRPLERGLKRAMPLRKAVPGVSGQLVRAIARAAHRDPERRYRLAEDLKESLWDELTYGPLEPVEEWQEMLSMPPLRAARQTSTGSMRLDDGPGPHVGPASMAEAGYARDPRFSPGHVTAVGATQRPPAVSVAEPMLRVSPQHLHLTDLKPGSPKKVALTVRNPGDAPLVGRVRSEMPWISAPDKTFRLPAHKQAKVLLTLDPSSAPVGRSVESRAIAVDTNVGRLWVAVTAEVASAPVLVVEEDGVDFGQIVHDGQQSLSLRVRNAGHQELSGTLRSRVPWLSVTPATFRLGANRRAEIRIDLLTDELPRGPQSVDDALLVDSDGGQVKLSARAWRVRPCMEVATGVVDLGVVRARAADAQDGSINGTMEIRNVGDGPLEGTVESRVPWLHVYPQSFVCEAGSSILVQLEALALDLDDGVIEVAQAVQLQSNGGGRMVGVRLEVQAPRLRLATENLDLGTVTLGQITDGTIMVANDGSLAATVLAESLVDWLTVSRPRLEVAPHDSSSSTVQLVPESVTSGVAVSDEPLVRLSSTGWEREVTGSLSVLAPRLSVLPESVDFGFIGPAEPATQEVIVGNEGTGQLAWNVQADAEWLELEPSAGVCAAGQQAKVTLRAYGLALDTGQAVSEATLVITSDGGRAKIPLRAGLASPLIATDTTHLQLGQSVNLARVGKPLRIFNHGLGALRGTIMPADTWIMVDRASFDCATGRSVEVKVGVDTEELAAQELVGEETRVTGVIHLSSNSSEESELDIRVSVDVVLAPVIEVPDCVEMSAVTEGDAASGRLVLKNTGMASARVDVAAPPHVTLSRDVVDIKPDKSARIRVQLNDVVPDEGCDRLVVSWGQEHKEVPLEFRT